MRDDNTPKSLPPARPDTRHGASGKVRDRAALKRRRDERLAEAARTSEEEAADGPLLIWGIHAVQAALANPARQILRLFATDNAALRLADAMAARKVQPEAIERVAPRDLDRRLGAETVHQGALLETSALPDHELLALAATAGERGPVVILDQVTDPHNVGAILRSAAVFGSAGLVMTRRNSPPLGGALAKAASGALDLVPIALVQNLSRALEDLKGAGLLTIGLDGAAPDMLDDVLLDSAARGPAQRSQPLALILGAEGKGLRELTSRTCDRLCRIATDGPLASLNVSNAAAVALHLAAMARRRQG